MVMKTKLVISGFPGIGKSTLTKNTDLVISDSDSSKFDKSNFPENYIKHIKSLLRGDKVDIILTSSHDIVREEMLNNDIPFVLVYPDKSLKKCYVERYSNRGSSPDFIKLLSEKWEEWIDQCEKHNGMKYVLKTPEDYLGNNIDNIIKYFNKMSQSLNEEGVVAGDHGGDPVKIASGESIGNFVNAGPGGTKKKKKTKLKRSKVKEIVERHKD